MLITGILFMFMNNGTSLRRFLVIDKFTPCLYGLNAFQLNNKLDIGIDLGLKFLKRFLIIFKHYTLIKVVVNAVLSN